MQDGDASGRELSEHVWTNLQTAARANELPQKSAQSNNHSVRAESFGFSRESKGRGSFVEKHWGPRPSDEFRKETGADGSVAIIDGIQRLVPSSRHDVGSWHHKLMKLAKTRISDEHEVAKFEANMVRFENRAKAQGLNPLELTKTYEQVTRLLQQKQNEPLTSEQRTHLAQQIMEHAGQPSSIDQGRFNTCGVSTIEVRTYSKYPYSAAKLVVDIALKGSFQASDGTLVKIDPKPREDNKIYPQPDGTRSHASYLFQLVGTNLIHEHRNKNSTPIAHLKYEQQKGNDPSSANEGLYDYEDVVSGKTSTPRFISNKPELWDDDLLNMSNMITGRKEKHFVLAHTGHGRGSDEILGRFASADQFQTRLLELKKNKLLPASLRIDSDADPFYTDSEFGKAGGSGGWHQVTIYGFEPATANKPAYVEIDNTWGSKADRLGTRKLTLEELYVTTRPSSSPETLQMLEEAAETRRKTQNLDLVKDLDLARLKLRQKTISKIEYVKEMESAIEQYKSANPAANIYEDNLLKIKIQQLTLPVFTGDKSGEVDTRASRLRFQFGIDSLDTFEKSVQKNALAIAEADTSKRDANEEKILNDALVALRKSISLLPKEPQERIADALQKDYPNFILDKKERSQKAPAKGS